MNFSPEYKHPCPLPASGIQGVWRRILREPTARTGPKSEKTFGLFMLEHVICCWIFATTPLLVDGRAGLVFLCNRGFCYIGLLFGGVFLPKRPPGDYIVVSWAERAYTTTPQNRQIIKFCRIQILFRVCFTSIPKMDRGWVLSLSLFLTMGFRGKSAGSVLVDSFDERFGSTLYWHFKCS